VPNRAASSGIPVTMHCCVSATAAWHSWGRVRVRVCVCACTCTQKRVLYVSLLGTGGGWHCAGQSSVQPGGQRDGVAEGGERVGAREGRSKCMGCFVLPASRRGHCSCHPCARGDGRSRVGVGQQEPRGSERRTAALEPLASPPSGRCPSWRLGNRGPRRQRGGAGVC